MRKARLLLAFFMFSAPLPVSGQLRYSAGAVSNYPAATCGGPNLPLDVPEARDFQAWYNLAGFVNVTRWENGDVWGSDFRDSTNGNNNDRDGSGGSDITQLYFFTGHGSCENPPVAGSGDFIITCGNFGKPDVTRIGTSSRWGNNGGQLRFLFLDASCPMDLPEIQSEWFAPFQGLHVATGNSGDVNHDTLDSETRGDQYAAHTVGGFSYLGIRVILFPQMSIGNAWMATGLIDVQSQVCAVALAAGNDRNDAVNRRENELITSNWGNPTPNWFAWKWVCN
jgi:Family of unknown function (DUF6345)